jgi:hypothetical protein
MRVGHNPKGLLSSYYSYHFYFAIHRMFHMKHSSQDLQVYWDKSEYSFYDDNYPQYSQLHR